MAGVPTFRLEPPRLRTTEDPGEQRHTTWFELYFDLVFVVAISVDLPGSIHYWRHGHSVITSGSELGPLAGPIKWFQVAGDRG